MWMLKPKTKSLKLPASQNFIYVLCVCGCESCNLWKRSLELQSNYTSRYYRTCMKCRRWQHQLSHVLFECLTWIGVLYCFWNNDEQLLPHIQRHISCGQSNSRGLFWFWRWLLPSLCCHFNNFNTQSQKNGLFRTHFKVFLMTFSHRANRFNGHFGYENVGLIMWASKNHGENGRIWKWQFWTRILQLGNSFSFVEVAFTWKFVTLYYHSRCCSGFVPFNTNIATNIHNDFAVTM